MKNYLTSRIKQSGSITVCVICPYCGFAQRERLKGLEKVICGRCKATSEKGRYYTKQQLLNRIHELRHAIDLRHKAAIDGLSAGIYPTNRGQNLRQQRDQLRCLVNAVSFYGMTTEQQSSRSTK
jgi:hypothetical protein